MKTLSEIGGTEDSGWPLEVGVGPSKSWVGVGPFSELGGWPSFSGLGLARPPLCRGWPFGSGLVRPRPKRKGWRKPGPAKEGRRRRAGPMLEGGGAGQAQPKGKGRAKE